MNELTIPRHIAIILDGNGRWAKAHGVPRKLGHKAGCETLERVTEDCARTGIKYLTVYAFSTENWKRSDDEVGALMQLFRYYIPKLRKMAMDNDIRILTIGDESRFDRDLQEGLDALKADTAAHKRMTFILGINYGARDEMRRAAVRMAEDVKNGLIEPAELTEEKMAAYLDTADIPDPDLIIRTSGEQRLSNFLLWQSAYAELYFPSVLWPDFDHEELMKAIDVYNHRDRRFGGRKESE